MLKNYFKIAWRNLWRNPIYSIISVSGMSVGLACCLLLFLYVQDEFSFDRFHTKRDRLYRISCFWGDEKMDREAGSVQRLLGPVLDGQLPELESYTRFANRTCIVKAQNNVFLEQLTFADSTFFKLFSFPFLSGNSYAALNGMQSVVLTRGKAIKYFGREDAIGQTLELQIDGSDFRFVVSGITEDIPENSSIQFDIVVNSLVYDKLHPIGQDVYKWINPAFTTFVLLNPHADPQQVEEKVNAIAAGYAGETDAEWLKDALPILQYRYVLQPLHAIHLHPQSYENEMARTSNPLYGKILFLLAVGILIIACINYINLTTSKTLKRSREFGVRKAIGSSGRQLVGQFVSENLLILLLSLVVSFALVAISLPWFSHITNKVILFSFLFNWKIAVTIPLLLLLTVVLITIRPALFAYRLQTVRALNENTKVAQRNLFTHSLVIVQFVLATSLIIACIIINLQSGFILKKDLGYNDENLLVIDLPRDESRRNGWALKNELQQYPWFRSVSLGKLSSAGTTVWKVDNKSTEVYGMEMDESFDETAELQLLEGRFLASGDDWSNVVVNEAFVKEFDLENPVGKQVEYGSGSMITIIGVIKDFHFSSLKHEIAPLAISDLKPDDFGYEIYVRTQPDNLNTDMDIIGKLFKKHFPYYPFKLQLQEDINKNQYKAELRWRQIVNMACRVAIFLACMGLFGLSMLTVQQRTKEIGVRKVLGASVGSILALLSGDFLKLVLIAIIIATPIAWYAMEQWLQDFAYRIEVQWWMFVLAGLLAVIIALLTVSFQSVKAALANPVKSLRND